RGTWGRPRAAVSCTWWASPCSTSSRTGPTPRTGWTTRPTRRGTSTRSTSTASSCADGGLNNESRPHHHEAVRAFANLCYIGDELVLQQQVFHAFVPRVPGLVV